MATELATAYVSLVIEDSKVPGQVQKTLAGLEPQATKTGQNMGSRMASGISSGLRSAVAGAGLIAAATLGTALSQGFKRMTAIDDAKGKLAGLGHEATGVATIMDSALASVKGTAFGLGDAATIAASAVAAGVKPGQDLTKYLKLTADAATIAGTSLGDMGSIVNKVTTSNKAYTDDLNQLSDRGIPIFQWLRDEYGVSADKLSEMVKQGKVDSETFQKVIQKNIGGAALESGKTLTGAWKNMQAALGRVGEGALAPFLPMMKSGLAAGTEWADKVTPKVKQAAQGVADGLTDLGRAFQSSGASVQGNASVYEQFGIKARKAYDKVSEFAQRVREAIAAFRQGENGDRLTQFWQTLTGAAGKASDGVQKLEKSGHSLSGVLSKLGSASADIGKSLLSLAGDTGTVAATGIRTLGTAMKFLADHSAIAATAMVGFVAVHGIGELATTFGNIGRGITGIFTPATYLATRAQTAALVAHNAALRALLAAMGQEVPAQQASMLARARAAVERAREAVATRAAATALGQYAAALRAAAANSGMLIGGIQRTAAAAAMLGARVQATAVAALGGLGRAASGLMSLMGGPWGIAIAAGGAALLSYKAAADQAKRVHEALSDAVVQGAKAQGQFRSALAASNGALDTNALEASTKLVSANMATITAVAKEGHSPWESFWNRTIDFNEKLGGWTNSWGRNIQSGFDTTQRAIEQNDTLNKVLSDQKLEMSDLGKVVADGGQPYDQLIAKLSATGDAGADVVSSLKRSRDEIRSNADAVKNSTPGFNTLADSIRTLADNSTNADQRLSAMKRALDALSGKPIEIGNAMQQFNKQLRDTSDLAKEWDKADGFGDQLINPDGTINTKTVNGDKLRTQFQSLKDSVLDVAKAGGDLGPVFEQVNAKYGELSKNTGLSSEQLADLAKTIGLMPKDIEIIANMRGADKATQDLTAIKLLLDNNRQGATIDTKLLGSKEIIDQLRATGAKVEEVTGKPGVFKVEASNIQSVIDQVDKLIRAKIPDKKFTIWSETQTADARQERFGNPSVQGPLPIPRATGGPAVGAVMGAGGPTSDSVPALLSRDEHVWTAAETDAVGGHGAMYRLRSLALAGGLRFAKGGTPFGVEKAIDAARAVEGNQYLWGGTGPSRFDCSGFVGFIQQIVMGIVNSTKRLYTTYSLLSGATAGLEPGLGPSGTWFQVGVSQEHMAATLAGQAIESGGAFGTSGIGGGRAKATDSQFPFKFHLPNSLIKGAGALSKGGKVIEWTDDDELELLQLQESVNQAREKRDKVYEDSKSSDSDKRKADLDVRSAQNKVVKKQEQKDKQGQIEGGSRVAPEAPALSKRWTQEESDRLDKLSAIETARERRNEVYDDPDATDLDRAKADAELSLAEQAADKSKKDAATTVRGVFTKAAESAAGAVFDAVKAQLPDKISGSHWWDVADQAIALANSDEVKDANPASILAGIGSFDPAQVAAQLGFIPGPDGKTPTWVDRLKGKAPKVFDSGGWLQPGEMGINLSNRPEPIFNSPQQLQQFAGGSLSAPAAAGRSYTDADIDRMIQTRPNVTFQVADINEAMRSYRTEQRFQALKSMRR